MSFTVFPVPGSGIKINSNMYNDPKNLDKKIAN